MTTYIVGGKPGQITQFQAQHDCMRPSHAPVSPSTFPQLPHLEVSDKHWFHATSPGEHNSGPGRPRTWRKLLITRKQAWVHSCCWSSRYCSFGLFESAPGGKTLTSALSSLHWHGAVQAEPYLCPSVCGEGRLWADAQSVTTARALPRRQALLWGWRSAPLPHSPKPRLSPSVEEGAGGQRKRGLCSWGRGWGVLKRVEEEISQLMWAVALLPSQVAPAQAEFGKTPLQLSLAQFFLTLLG